MRVFLFLNNKTISTKNNSDIKSISDKYKKRTAHRIFDLEDVRVISQDRSTISCLLQRTSKYFLNVYKIIRLFRNQAKLEPNSDKKKTPLLLLLALSLRFPSIIMGEFFLLPYEIYLPKIFSMWNFL